MKCNEIEELLSLYIDKMLDESEIKEVEEHLSVCDACRKEYEELMQITELLGQTGTVPVPDAFSFRLRKALKEEKQSMIDAGIITRPSKRKPQWRIITSIAAVFAVGVLSFGFYHDVLGNLPGTGGGEQTGADKTVKAYDMTGKGLSEAANEKSAGSNSTSDGSVVMKDQSPGLASSAETFDSAASDDKQKSNQKNALMTPAAPAVASEAPDDNSAAGQTGSAGDQSAGVRAETYGAAASTEPSAAAADAGSASKSLNGSDGTDQNVPMFSKAAPAPSPEDECSRSLNAAGVERNAAAVQFYNNLIEEKLKGFDYQMLGSSYTQNGEWQFRIFIFRGKDGNTYNEEITIIGKEGKIEVVCSDDFLGL